MIECDAIRPQITALLDGELSPAATAEVEAHVNACAACAAMYADTGILKTAARPAAPIPPVDLWIGVGDAIDEAADYDMLDTMRLLRQEMQSLREEVAALRQELARRPSASVGTPISLPDAPRKSMSQYRLV